MSSKRERSPPGSPRTEKKTRSSDEKDEPEVAPDLVFLYNALFRVDSRFSQHSYYENSIRLLIKMQQHTCDDTEFIPSNLTQAGQTAFALALAGNPPCRKVHFANQVFDKDMTLLNAVTHSRVITRVGFDTCTFPESLELGDHDAARQNQTLREFNLTGYLPGPQLSRVIELASCFPKLAYLNLAHSGMSRDALEELCCALPQHTSLNALGLSFNTLHGEVIDRLSGALDESPHIKSLGLRATIGVSWSRSVFADQADARAMIRLIKRNKTLTYLDISGCSVASQRAGGINRLMRRALATNRTLKALRLCQSLCDTSAPSVACSIVKVTVLTHLCLAGSRVEQSTKGVERLVGLLAQHRSLKHLDLSACRLSNAMWSDVLRHNTRLEYLNLSANNFTLDTIHTMTHAAAENKASAIRRLSFGGIRLCRAWSEHYDSQEQARTDIAAQIILITKQARQIRALLHFELDTATIATSIGPFDVEKDVEKDVERELQITENCLCLRENLPIWRAVVSRLVPFAALADSVIAYLPRFENSHIPRDSIHVPWL